MDYKEWEQVKESINEQFINQDCKIYAVMSSIRQLKDKINELEDRIEELEEELNNDK